MTSGAQNGGTLMLTLAQLFKCLSDETRLRCVVLLQSRGELCVCELTAALRLPQPKISRHLAQLRAYGLLQDRRQGLWVYYRIHPQLPQWALALLREAAAAAGEDALFRQDGARLENGSVAGAERCCADNADAEAKFPAVSVFAENAA
jgi:ArsR family transcriptional regulator